MNFVLALMCLALAAVWLWRGPQRRGRARDLMDAWLRNPEDRTAFDDGTPGGAAEFPRRYRWATYAVAALVAAAVWFFTSAQPPFAFAFGALAGVGAWLLESYLAERQVDRMESQLADAIDLMVGSLRAGAALLASLEAALREAQEPFASELREMIGRIRMGEDPAESVRALAARAPLESFRFFAVSVAVHWETGGSLATTLVTVARTIRERTEMARRIRAQSVEANFSVLAVMAITYGVTIMMWRTNPESIGEFLRSPTGAWLASACILLQAFGAWWISQLSRVEH